MTKISLGQQIEEVDRELELRGRVYPIEIAKGRMRKSIADYHLARLGAVRNTLLWLQQNEARIRGALGNGRDLKTSDTHTAGDALRSS